MKFLIAILIGISLAVLSLVLQAALGGTCHCSTPLMSFFPFLSMFGVHAELGVLRLLLLGLQFPAYAICVAMAKGPNWKARVLVILLAVHAWAVWLAFKING